MKTQIDENHFIRRLNGLVIDCHYKNVKNSNNIDFYETEVILIEVRLFNYKNLNKTFVTWKSNQHKC